VTDSTQVFRRAWLVTFAAFVLVGTIWSVSQPVFAGADEIMHAYESEAVWSGQFLPPLTTALTSQIKAGVEHVDVLTTGQSCFDVDHTQSAKCDSISLHGKAEMGPVDNYISREPPLSAIVTGLPFALAPDRTGFYLSRFLTALLGASLFATAVALALSRRRHVLFLGILVAVTPSIVAEWGVLGTSQMEIGAALVLWVCITLFLNGERLTRSFVGLLFGSFMLLLLSRPISFVYAGAVVIAVLVCANRARLRELLEAPYVKPLLIASFCVVVFALVWFVAAEAPPNYPVYLRALHLPHITSWEQRISFSLGYVQDFWNQMIGAIGANEYAGPAWLTIAWTLLAGGFIGAGILLAVRRRAAVIVGLLGFLFLLSVGAQAFYLPKLYLTWQGRYDLPTFVGIVVLSAGSIEGRLGRTELTRMMPFVVIVVAGLQVVEFAGVLRRYVVGTNGPLNPFGWGSGWHPPLMAATTLLVVGIVVIVGAYGGLLWLGRRSLELPVDGPNELVYE
jgi:hypothetical protein